MGSNDLDQLLKIFEIMGIPSEFDLPEVKDKTFVFPIQTTDKPLKKYKDLLMEAGFEDNEMDLLTKMLIYNPNNRICAKAALSHPYFDDLI